ncbi:MAG TPA: hypothetical protein VG426_01635 [Candidatus Dormibacteraeota bacterium]|nr:hypothetical protein [Candidatus Dormibacteraeota bacterium]
MTAPSLLGVIVRSELRAFRNRLLKRNAVGLAAIGVLLLFAGGPILGGAFALGAAAGHFLTLATDSLLAAAFTGLSILMLLIGFPTVIATLFVGRDLLQLVVAPVHTRDIFVARLLIAMAANLLISSIVISGVLGIGAGSGAPWVFFPMAVVLLAAQVIVITALQAILMAMILRWVPARLARDVAAGVAGLTGAALYLAWNLSLRQTFTRRAPPDVSILRSLVQRIDWLPTTWPGHALSSTVNGTIASALVWSVATILLASVLFVIAALLYERTLLSGLGIFGDATAVWRRRGQRVATPGAAGGTGSPFLAIARKDWLGFRRDVRRLTRLLPALLLPLGYAVALSQPGRSLTGFWSNVALVTFLSMFMSSALASPSVPSERRGFQLLRMAPFPMWQLLRAKVFIALPPVMAMMIVFVVVVDIASKSGAGQLLGLVVFGTWLAAGFVSISVSGGAIDPRFEATDDRRSVGIVGTLTAIGGSLGFALMSVGALALFFFGSQAVTGTANFGPIPSTPAIGIVMMVIGLLLLVAGGILVGILLVLANSRLRSFEAAISAT